MLKKILHWLGIAKMPYVEQSLFKSFYVSIGGFYSQMQACRLATAIQETFDLSEECVRVEETFVKPVLRSVGKIKVKNQQSGIDVQGKEKTVCPFCRHTVVKGNFCTYCSKKLVRQCDCWVKKQKYNCGFSQCPGVKLELILSAGEITERKHRYDKQFKKIFINTSVNHKGTCDGLLNKKTPECSLQRLSVYVETKKELDKKLRDIPGGNKEIINKLYELFDEAIIDELIVAKKILEG